ncbi:MAG: electron transport complex protein RnfC, partial [Synergistales bacterium]|nr:electron transport complex protein RnfC [Synergistales bacterium]
SCPEDLDPKNVCAQNKRRILAEKRRWENPPFVPERADRLLKNRRAPTARLMRKLGLTVYPNVGPLVERTVVPQRVGIKLKQHAGVPCEPVVQVGDRVERGQVIGRPPLANGKPALGAPVHASIAGRVSAIRDGIVWIERE